MITSLVLPAPPRAG